MKKETKFDKEKIRKIIRNITIITGIFIPVFFGLMRLRNHTVHFVLIIFFWTDVAVFLLSLIVFLIIRGRYKDRLEEKEEAKARAEKQAPVLMIFLILSVILDLLGIIMLAIWDVANLCAEMGCIGYWAGFTILLIISVTSTIILSIRFIDKRKLAKISPVTHNEEV